MTHQSTIYRHTQIGWAVLIAFAISGAIMVFTKLMMPSEIPNSLVAGILGMTIALSGLFGQLTVTVTASHVICQFGLGLFAKRFEVVAIDAVDIVTNPWYYGWGIRLTPEGVMYNVSGFQAVRLVLASGKRFRIGTDEPERLQGAIVAAMNGSADAHGE